MTFQPSSLPLDPAALRGLFDLFGEPLLLLDEKLELLDANPAARQLLGLDGARGLHAIHTGHGGRLVDWLRLATRAIHDGRRGPAAPPLNLPHGRRATLNLAALEPTPGEAARWLLHARLDEKSTARAGKPMAQAFGSAPMHAPPEAGPGWARELVKIFWSSPFPAYVHDSVPTVLGANAALLELLGRPLEDLLGSDPRQLRAAGGEPEFQLLDGSGHLRTMRATVHPINDPGQPPVQLVVLQDCTAERAAREQAERAQYEMEQWLALSPLAMVLFDEQGLLLRSNSAFAALSLALPATLHEAEPALQQLLGWDLALGRPVEALRHGDDTLVTQASLLDPQGRTRWLTGRLRPLSSIHSGSGGLPRRYMAVLEDRSSEQERDLAHQQLDALMDTAGVGLATFQQDAGWLRPRPGRPGNARAQGLAGLQGVGRDIVEPGSLAEFERLQKALKRGDRIEVRYAVRHPELGRRWLLTRVEPGQLASGQRTTSVVTLDITAQAQAQARSEQLLHELTTIMDSAGLGLAYLRGAQLVRCNRDFETMLSLAEPAQPGAAIAQLFGALPDLAARVAAALPTLDARRGFDAEFVQAGGAAEEPRWLSLSLRRVAARAEGSEAEAVAVITDISRLKAQQSELEALVQDRELMFSLSDVGIAILRNGRIARANEALAALTGYRIRELDGLAHRELFDDEQDFAHHQSVVQQALEHAGIWRGERRVRRRDGTELWMQISKRVMRPGAPDEGLIATYVNVDDRWRAQQSLMLQTERERAILDSVLVGIVTVGRAGIEWMNRSARRMFGGDLIEFVGQAMAIVATPDPDHPFRQTHYLDELDEGRTETFECRLQALDGREFWVVGNAVVTGTQASGRQLTYALLDIDRRRQAEAQTRQAQTSLTRIIEAAPVAISLHDAQTLAVEQINQAAADLAGRSEAELMGSDPEQLFGPEHGAQIRQDMLDALLTDAVTHKEYKLGHGEHRRVWDARLLHLAPTPVGGDGEPGAPEQLLFVASDVTEQRAAEEARLQAAISQRELLVREVHHRIKNNLQGVAGLLQQIAVRRPEVAPVINEAVGQVQAIAQVYGLQVGSSGPLRVQRVIEAIIGAVQRSSGRQIALALEGETAADAQRWTLPEAESIPIALTFNELLNNALKHGGGSAVSCTLVCGDVGVAVEVRNRGTLPPGFDILKIPGSVSGLGLVRALLPRRSASLGIEQRGDEVLSRVDLWPPSVSLPGTS